MKTKLTALLLTFLMFSLAGCQLAREPSQQQSENATLDGARFVGVYVVREDPYAEIDRTLWTQFGSSTVETEVGTLPFQREILIGQYDEDTREITFPGMDGFALFAMAVNSEVNGRYHTLVSDMVGSKFHLGSTDAGTNYEVSGTLYYGPPIDEPNYDQWDDPRIWHHYHVYQMEDGTVFLNGYGDSHNGAMGSTVTMTNTSSVDGEEAECYTKVEVNVEYIERLETLTVCQYDKGGNLLESLRLPVNGELPCVKWLTNADWAVVEELRGGELTRTAYDRPAEGDSEVSHTVILLEDDGSGTGGVIRFE